MARSHLCSRFYNDNLHVLLADLPSSDDKPDTSGYLLSEDDLADFPDEIVDIARRFVGKPLIQALVDVRCLDPILYKVINFVFVFTLNDILNAINHILHSVN